MATIQVSERAAQLIAQMREAESPIKGSTLRVAADVLLDTSGLTHITDTDKRLMAIVGDYAQLVEALTAPTE